jgi:hypothetical protein
MFWISHIVLSCRIVIADLPSHLLHPKFFMPAVRKTKAARVSSPPCPLKPSIMLFPKSIFLFSRHAAFNL